MQISPSKLNDFNTAKSALKKLLIAMSQAQITQQKFQCLTPELLFPSETESKSVENPCIRKELDIFCKNLSLVPGVWIKHLLQDRIQSEKSLITINTSVTLTEIYTSLIKNCEQGIKQDRSHQGEGEATFQQMYVSQTCLALIAELLNNYAANIASCFMEGQQLISKKVEVINQTIKKCEIMNSYILFGMLKQMASQTQKTIREDIHRKIPQLSQSECQQFCKYIQKNYEFIQLACLQSGMNCIYSKKQYAQYINERNQVWLAWIRNENENNITLKKIRNTKGKTGILIIRKSQTISKQEAKTQKNEKDDEDQKLVLKIEKGNQIKVINAKICQESWRIFETKDSLNEIYENLHKQIDTSGKSGKKEYVSYGVPTCEFATIGGSLGKCLADINEYHSANQFFLDLSKTAAIYTTISYAMAEIPILSYFIIAGGFTYSFYLACSNEATSSFKKFQQIKNFTMSVVGSVGSTIGGRMLGQAVIPVPFVGAFIGGVLGGFLGTKGVRDISQFLAKSNFRQIISYMKSKLIAGRYWQCNKHLLERIGLSEQYFSNHTEADQKSRDIQITAICFCIVTFYESKRYVEFNKQKMHEHKSKFKSEPFEREAHEQELFQNQFNMVEIVDYLTEQGYMIGEHLEQMGNFISHLV